MQNAPLLLIINDGWGVAPPSRANAITQANTPVFNHLLKNYWVTTLAAGGEAVGLPWGEMGNSEVGHLTLGSGKILYQDLPRITKAIGEGIFFKNSAFLDAILKVKKDNGALHIAGLLSDGGVHSHYEHLLALLDLAVDKQAPRIVIHCFLDGRDVPFNSAIGFIDDLENKIKQLKAPAKIGSVAGRYFAMDRDNRWERIQTAYRAMVCGESEKSFISAKDALAFYYKQEIYDEHIPPTALTGAPPIVSADAVIFFNFRADRMRQMAGALSLPEFDKFERKEYLKNVSIVTMTEYDKELSVKVAFPKEVVTHPLAYALSEAGVKQLHIAETEKYAHVTYFFNGGRERAFEGEDRILVPSRPVSDYSTVPEMSAREITNRLEHAINAKTYQFLVVNFANADMVGHTGNLRATIHAVEMLDKCMRQLSEAVLAQGGIVLITADHGNAEAMFERETGEINKEHTNNPVPCILIGRSFVEQKESIPDLSALTARGVLSDVAPTILKLMGLTVPSEMTGHPLV